MQLAFNASDGGFTPVTVTCSTPSGTAQINDAKLMLIRVENETATPVTG
jgi:hypothetical protein